MADVVYLIMKNIFKIFQSIETEQYCVFEKLSDNKHDLLSNWKMIDAFNNYDHAVSCIEYLQNRDDSTWLKCSKYWPPDNNREIVIRKIGDEDIRNLIFTPANEIYFDVGEDNKHEYEWMFTRNFNKELI